MRADNVGGHTQPDHLARVGMAFLCGGVVGSCFPRVFSRVLRDGSCGVSARREPSFEFVGRIGGAIPDHEEGRTHVTGCKVTHGLRTAANPLCGLRSRKEDFGHGISLRKRWRDGRG